MQGVESRAGVRHDRVGNPTREQPEYSCGPGREIVVSDAIPYVPHHPLTGQSRSDPAQDIRFQRVCVHYIYIQPANHSTQSHRERENRAERPKMSKSSGAQRVFACIPNFIAERKDMHLGIFTQQFCDRTVLKQQKLRTDCCSVEMTDQMPEGNFAASRLRRVIHKQNSNRIHFRTSLQRLNNAVAIPIRLAETLLNATPQTIGSTRPRQC